jgi:hypothetical protein
LTKRTTAFRLFKDRERLRRRRVLMYRLPERAVRWLEDGFRRRTWGKWLWSRNTERRE